MIAKAMRGFRAVPKQDGSGKITIERVPYFGLDSSTRIAQRNRNRSNTRRRVKVLKPGQAVMFHPTDNGRGKR